MTIRVREEINLHFQELRRPHGKARGRRIASYLVPERKLGFFVKIKEDENFNHRNTGSISRIKI